MKQHYLSIAARLREVCPFLRTIDIDRGQLDIVWAESSRPAVAYPCVLLRLSVSRREDLTPTLQECTATLTVTYATDRVQETADHVPEERRMAGLAPYDEADEIYGALQGWDADGTFAPLSRVREESVRLHDGIFAERFTFETEYRDV